MLPPQIADEIAKRSLVALASYGLKSAHGRAPGYLPDLPTLIIAWDRIEVAEMSEQINILRFRGSLFTSLEPIPSQISTVDAMIMPLIDAFSPNLNRTNYRLLTASGQGVDFCTIGSAELSIPIVYNDPNNPHYGGRIYWNVKLRRFAGGT